MKKIALFLFSFSHYLINCNLILANPHAIIIGATSCMGKEIARVLSKKNYVVGLAGPRKKLLQSLQKELPNKSFTQVINIFDTEQAREQIYSLIKQMEKIDLIVINTGIGYNSKSLDWHKEKKIIDVNITGFTALSNIAINYFIEQKQGHLIGISSLRALKGNSNSPVYIASKAYIFWLLNELKDKVERLGLPINIVALNLICRSDNIKNQSDIFELKK